MQQNKKKKENPRLKRPTEEKPIPLQSIRISSKDLHAYHYTRRGWKKANIFLPNTMQAVKLFRVHNNMNELVDKKHPEFLKGMLLPDGTAAGARISILPDGKKLDKAFSLFSEHLTIHDETSNDHWDVLYQNKGGTFSYVYTLEKKEEAKEKKYRAVDEFAKVYNKLAESVARALYDKKDYDAMPMYTLLKTFMRVGNETYYKAHGHKGLTTIKKHDLRIRGKNVTFNYLAKDGVPFETTSQFPEIYVKRLKRTIRPLDQHSFVFVNKKTLHPISEFQFKKAFERYCGIAFYPHIVRSFYATQRVKEFLRQNKNPSREQTREFLRTVAGKLGHKKYDKKQEEWKEDYTVTLNHYVAPELSERIRVFLK